MAFWFSSSRKYEKGQHQKYTTLRDGDVEVSMPRAENPNALDSKGPQVSCLLSPEAPPAEIQFLVQMGVKHCYVWLTDEQSTFAFMHALVQKLRRSGITLVTAGNVRIGKNPDIILNLPGRAAAIKRFKAFLLDLKRAGCNTSIFTWEPTGVTNSHYAKVRGGAEGRAVHADILAQAPLNEFGRSFSEEELWGNMQSFLEEMMPFCEREDVRLALHPNDPPVPNIAGIPCLIRNKQAYERVFAMALQSRALGMEFCCGCWLEGAQQFGDLQGSLQEYTERDKIIKVHLRNVTAPLPAFVETYLDDGYGDIFLLIRTLVRAGYRSTIILDHSPPFVDEAGPGAPTAFSIGYIKACIRAAETEWALERKRKASAAPRLPLLAAVLLAGVALGVGLPRFLTARNK